jgi:hypothetical protein
MECWVDVWCGSECHVVGLWVDVTSRHHVLLLFYSFSFNFLFFSPFCFFFPHFFLFFSPPIFIRLCSFQFLFFFPFFCSLVTSPSILKSFFRSISLIYQCSLFYFFKFLFPYFSSFQTSLLLPFLPSLYTVQYVHVHVHVSTLPLFFIAYT